MRFKRDDRVRLLRESSGVPAGTDGTVMVFNRTSQRYHVQFFGFGTHEVSEDLLEPQDKRDG